MQIDGVEADMPAEVAATLPQAPAPQVPASVTNFQARAVLRARFLPDGRSLLTAVNDSLTAARTAAAGLPESDPQRLAADLAWQAWEQSNDVERGSQIVQQFAGLFGLTDADLDGLFIAAAAVSA
jgi:hypothetical protein